MARLIRGLGELARGVGRGPVRGDQAEAHGRLSAPLLNIALALVALVGVLMGDFSRRGYGRRIMWAAIIALVIRLASLMAQATAADEPAHQRLPRFQRRTTTFVADHFPT